MQLKPGRLGGVILSRAATITVLILLTASSGGCVPTLDVTPSEVLDRIESSLRPGDNAEKIEAYFDQQQLDASFDRFNQRYQSIIRHPKSNYHAIVIYIYVDEERRFTRAEAKNSYTMW